MYYALSANLRLMTVVNWFKVLNTYTARNVVGDARYNCFVYRKYGDLARLEYNLYYCNNNKVQLLRLYDTDLYLNLSFVLRIPFYSTDILFLVLKIARSLYADLQKEITISFMYSIMKKHQKYLIPFMDHCIGHTIPSMFDWDFTVPKKYCPIQLNNRNTRYILKMLFDKIRNFKLAIDHEKTRIEYHLRNNSVLTGTSAIYIDNINLRYFRNTADIHMLEYIMSYTSLPHICPNLMEQLRRVWMRQVVTN